MMSFDRLDARSLSWPSQDSHGSASWLGFLTLGAGRLLFTLEATAGPADRFGTGFAAYGALPTLPSLAGTGGLRGGPKLGPAEGFCGGSLD